MKVEVAVLGSPVPNKPYGFCGRKATLNSGEKKYSAALFCSHSELRSCVNVEVAVLGSPSLIVMVSVDVKQH